MTDSDTPGRAGHPPRRSLVLPVAWEPTRATLHGYVRAIGALTRAHAVPHPQWWHLALRVRADGLSTVPLPLPGGGAAGVVLDIANARVALVTSTGSAEVIRVGGGMAAVDFEEALLTWAAAVGLDRPAERAVVASSGAAGYDDEDATTFWRALLDVATVLEARRSALPGAAGPVCFWPHGFDLAFEWFGPMVVERGPGREVRAQLNLGFYPGSDPYFYSSPWPFDETLPSAPLPGGASWNTSDWKGAALPVGAIAGDPEWSELVLAFAEAVYDAALPSLTA